MTWLFCAERGVPTMRPSGVRAVGSIGLVCAVVVPAGISACASPSAPTGTSTRSPKVPSCDSHALTVTVDAELAVHVRNKGTEPCRLRGRPAVTMTVGRIEGEVPTTDVILAAGTEFVQPLGRVEAATACATPMSAGLPRPGLWTVVVQDQTFHPVAADGRLVGQVVNCWVVTLPPGHLAAG